ncbi:MAG: DUF1080 domain-containing protein [Abitibacteriaceae bacterium]|nr:DUF1080 domain-containing protein [Abditibacteriaceae bacterium]MBV9864285.1 DUF1080 domain-containing protein [Abditibacteriaceae bacterium]
MLAMQQEEAQQKLLYSISIISLVGLIMLYSLWPLTAARAATTPNPQNSTSASTVKYNGEFVALEPETAGPDFKLQGEYVGTLTAMGSTPQKFAAQVVAIGSGAFRAYLLPGGLPGAGWDGTSKWVVQGRTEGDKTTLQSYDGKGYSITINGDSITGQTAKGEKLELNKIVRESPTVGAPPPTGALVLFNGTDLTQWRQGRMDERKLLAAMLNPQVKRIGAGPLTKKGFKDFFLHVEFRLPFKPLARSQGRSNSGVCLQNRYEIQVLDTFGSGLGIKTAEGDVCGDIFAKAPAQVNMCLPPLSWQTYDIDFQAARFDKTGKKIKNARATIKLNGVVVQNNQEINGSTHLMQPESPQDGPLMLQDHGSPVFFRNIWLVPK